MQIRLRSPPEPKGVDRERIGHHHVRRVVGQLDVQRDDHDVADVEFGLRLAGVVEILAGQVDAVRLRLDRLGPWTSKHYQCR